MDFLEKLEAAGILTGLPGKETAADMLGRLALELEAEQAIPASSPLGRLMVRRWFLTAVADAHAVPIRGAIEASRNHEIEVRLVREYMARAMDGPEDATAARRHFDPELWRLGKTSVMLQKLRERTGDTLSRLRLLTLGCIRTRLSQQLRVLAEDGMTEVGFARSLGYSDRAEAVAEAEN